MAGEAVCSEGAVPGRRELRRDLLWTGGILIAGGILIGLGACWKPLAASYYAYRLEQHDMEAAVQLKKLMPAAIPHLVRIVEERQPLREQTAVTAATPAGSGSGPDDPVYLAAAKVLGGAGPGAEESLLRRIDELRAEGMNADHMLAALSQFPTERARQLYSEALVSGRLGYAYGSKILPDSSGSDAVLLYLACRQEPDGSWDASRWGASGASDVEVTSLAVLAFTNVGYTPRCGKYRAVVGRGLAWIVQHQREDGRVGGGSLRDHVLAGITLSESWGLTKQPGLRAAAEKALKFTIEHQLPAGGWSEDRPPVAKTFLTSLCVLQLKSAKIGALGVDLRAFQQAARVVHKTPEDSPPASGKDAPERPSLRGLAGSASACLEMGFRRKDPLISAAADRLLQERSRVFKDPYATLLARWLMFRIGGKHWRVWQRHTREVLLDNRPDRAMPRGSWPYASAECDRLGSAGTAALRSLILYQHHYCMPFFEL
jgi:hypothetical protein